MAKGKQFCDTVLQIGDTRRGSPTHQGCLSMLRRRSVDASVYLRAVGVPVGLDCFTLDTAVAVAAGVAVGGSRVGVAVRVDVAVGVRVAGFAPGF